MTMMVKSNLGQTREMEMSHCGKEGKNRILFSTCTLNYQITLSPATPKGANVGAVNVFVDSLQFVCQNGQVLIAVLMNGQIRTQEATTYHAQFGNPPQSPISFCGRRTSGDVGLLCHMITMIVA